MIELMNLPGLQEPARHRCRNSGGSHIAMQDASHAPAPVAGSICTKRVQCSRSPNNDARMRCSAGISPRPRSLAPRSGILDDRAEQLPALAVEPHHLHLLVDAVVGWRGIGDHAGQRQAAGGVL